MKKRPTVDEARTRLDGATLTIYTFANRRSPVATYIKDGRPGRGTETSLRRNWAQQQQRAVDK